MRKNILNLRNNSAISLGIFLVPLVAMSDQPTHVRTESNGNNAHAKLYNDDKNGEANPQKIPGYQIHMTPIFPTSFRTMTLFAQKRSRPAASGDSLSYPGKRLHVA